MNNTLLEIKDLYVNAEEKKILKGLNLKINKGEVHVVIKGVIGYFIFCKCYF